MTSLLDDLYVQCVELLKKGVEEMPKENIIRKIYDDFSVEELNQSMVEILRPEGVTTPVEIVYQSIEGLHKAIPNHPGDWYFTGHYPTPGGLRLLYKSYVDWYTNWKG